MRYISCTIKVEEGALTLDLCRNVYQELSKLGSLELQAVLNKMLDEVATPIKFCQYKLHGPSGADSSLKVPDSPSGKLIQVCKIVT